MRSTRATAIVALVLATLLFGRDAEAQTLFGSGCAGASGVTPTLAVSGVVKDGQNWTLQVTAPGGIGLGYLVIGFSNTKASVFGGLPLPFDFGFLFGGIFGDPLWNGCPLNVDPSYGFAPFVFDPNASGGVASLTLPGFDFGTVYVQAINIDPDFATRIAGVSQGLAVRRVAPAGMVAIAPGTFEMGSNASGNAPYFGLSNARPVHSVTISYPFWMGAHEVTQAEYQALIGSNPSFFVGPNRPVERVTWFDARAYCTALTAAETLTGNVPVGYEFRLPTEAEWEYACRAGTTTEFSVGPNLFCDQAEFEFSYHSSSSCGSGGTVDVGTYAPNPWGLYDMHGNVFEWCLDTFASYDYAPVTDPFVTGSSPRVFRGGNFNNGSESCRSAYRGAGNPAANGGVGLRVVLGPVLVP